MPGLFFSIFTLKVKFLFLGVTLTHDWAFCFPLLFHRALLVPPHSLEWCVGNWEIALLEFAIRFFIKGDLKFAVFSFFQWWWQHWFYAVLFAFPVDLKYILENVWRDLNLRGHHYQWSNWNASLNELFFENLFLVVLGLCCCTGFSPVAASGGYSSLQGTGLSLQRLLLLWSVGSRVCGLRSTGSGVLVHGLSCSVASGIFPDQGSYQCLLHWPVDSSPLSHQGSPVINSLSANFPPPYLCSPALSSTWKPHPSSSVPIFPSFTIPSTESTCSSFWIFSRRKYWEEFGTVTLESGYLNSNLRSAVFNLCAFKQVI